MAPPFIIPPNLETLEQTQDGETHHLVVQNPIDLTSFRPAQLEEFVKGVSFDLSDKELFCIEEQDVFDRVYSLVQQFGRLTPSCKFNIVESLRSNFSVLLPNVNSLSRTRSDIEEGEDEDVAGRIASHRNAFKIYSFFLLSIVVCEEGSVASNVGNNSKVGVSTKKGKTSSNLWNWESQRGRIVNLIANSLDLNLVLLFGSSELDSNYLSFIMKIAFSMFENAVVLKDSDTKDSLCRIIGTCSTKYHQTETSCASILHLIYRYDFSLVHLADAVARAEEKYADGSLAVSIIREIARTNPKDYVREAVGADNVGRFLVELADKLPKLISVNIGILVPHFGGESYKIRSALVGVLGKLVAKAFKDIEGEVSSKNVRLRSKQAMLEILLERCRDVSAYTRSRVLQVWSELCEEHAISIGLWNEVAEIAAGRLEDKSAIVRKSSLNLLIAMLQHNPFGPQLRIASFEATLEKFKEKIGNDEQEAVPSETVIDGIPFENYSTTDGEAIEHLDSVSDSSLAPAEEEEAEKDSSVPNIGNLEQIKALVASLEAGLRFSKCVSDMMPILVQLMASSSASDVENTILLLMRCRQFQIDGSESCLRKMLPLVFSQDKSIFEAVESAFVTIYIKKSPSETAKNLLNLAINSSIGDHAALEFLVDALVSKGDISTSTISALWDYFSFSMSGVTAEQSRGALSVLCMTAKSSTVVLGSHLQDIIDIGFGRRAKEEPLLARTACIALQRLSKEDKEKLIMNNGARVFGILHNLVTGFSLPESIWYAFADKAIAAIYAVHPTPESLASDVVKASLKAAFSCSTLGDELPIDSDNTKAISQVQVMKLSRYLFVVGHVALNQLVYIEACLRKLQKQRRKRDSSDSQCQEDQSISMYQANSSTKDAGINAELGIVASDDAMLDTLSERAEREIISSASLEKNLIGQCAPFLSKLCRNFSLMEKYSELQASGMLALCRFMIIDADFCEKNLQLLFTVVDSSPSEVVRSNCTIAIGDLAVRFPNLLEPWTENIYARLRDSSISVRKNAVLVLSHLILNDMMKVKGFINEMAVRVEDEEERISSLAKLFFHELSKKGSNPIYNLLPDILGRLSNQNLNKEVFSNIMQFLIGSIKKDKQMESLVEKLCNRFSGVTDVKQWECIAYCLSQLTFTEKGIKKLMESFKSYEHVLSEDYVIESFKNIINKSKKFAKPDLKSSIEEFEEKLHKFHAEKKEQEITARNVQVHQQNQTTLEGLLESKGIEDELPAASIYEDGEVIDPFVEDGTTPVTSETVTNETSEGSSVQSEKSVDASSSVLTDCESSGIEVQSPRLPRTGTLKSKAKKISTRLGKENAPSKRQTRSNRR